jgi:hypothetical protein
MGTQSCNTGSLDSWQGLGTLPVGRFGHGALTNNNFVYVLGGNNGSNALNDVQVLNLTGTGYTASTPFPNARFNHSSVLAGGYLYVLGGDSGTALLSDVEAAPILGSGLVGTWGATTALPTARSLFAGVAANGFVYVIGGQDSTGALAEVWYASVGSGGTLGTWTSTTALPSGRMGLAAAVFGNFVYALGGGNTTSIPDVLFAPINANGSLGSWTATTALPAPRALHAVAVGTGFLYVLGGYNGTLPPPGGSLYGDTQQAAINADGTLGSWVSQNSFSGPRYGNGAVVNSGNIYDISGAVNPTSPYQDVQLAAIIPPNVCH